MAPVTANRLRWGALAWLLTLQFFVVETVVQLQMPFGYSRTRDVISALGAAVSPGATLMNASFVVQGVLILGGALLLRPALRGGAATAAVVLLGVSAVGVLLVGAFPLDGVLAAHRTGAALHLVGGGLGLIALAYAVRPRSELLGTTLAILGLIDIAGTVFFLAGVTHFLGEGGTERAAAYVLPIGLAIAGVALWRMGADPAADDERAQLRAEREAARATKAERDRERDAALEAAAARRADDDEDHWTTTAGD